MPSFEMTALLEWFGVDYFLNPHKRVYWLFLLTSIIIVIAYLYYKNEKLSHYLRRSYWLHPSAKLDYAYFLLISFIKVIIIFPLMIGVGETSFFVLQQLNAWFGYQPAINLNRTIIVLLYTTTLFVGGDFTRYWLHRWLHSSDILWQFHKVHHSAEVLTPATFYRVHPVENILFGMRYALTTGLITGGFVYLFGARLEVVDILGVNLFIFISLIFGANLRHSPVYFRYPKFLEGWLISPAQHQLHHTPEGARKNYAGVLALWDRLFGSLAFSEEEAQKEPLKTFGFRSDSLQQRDSYSSLMDLIFEPFFNIKNIIRKYI